MESSFPKALLFEDDKAAPQQRLVSKVKLSNGLEIFEFNEDALIQKLQGFIELLEKSYK